MPSPLWRHLTHPDGMTVSLLVKATGMTVKEVRAELRALEADGQAIREKAPPGYEHLWWRRGSQPLNEDSILLAMMLARLAHPTPGKLRAILRRLAARAQYPGQRQVLTMAATSSDPHRMIDQALALHEQERQREKLRMNRHTQGNAA